MFGMVTERPHGWSHLLIDENVGWARSDGHIYPSRSECIEALFRLASTRRIDVFDRVDPLEISGIEREI